MPAVGDALSRPQGPPYPALVARVPKLKMARTFRFSTYPALDDGLRQSLTTKNAIYIDRICNTNRKHPTVVDTLLVIHWLGCTLMS